MFVDDLIKELTQQIVSEVNDSADDRVTGAVHQSDILFEAVRFFSRLWCRIDSDQFIILIEQLHILKDPDIVIMDEIFLLQ